MKNVYRFLLCWCVALWASALNAQQHWTFDYRQYQNDMTIYFMLKNDGSDIRHLENYEVAAFVGDECRGLGEFVTTAGSNGQSITYGYLRVYSNQNNGESITIKVYDKKFEKEIDAEASPITFESQSAVGLPSLPSVFTVVVDESFQEGDVNGDGKINATDVRLLINRRFNRPTPAGFIEAACDMNGDKRINATDVRLLINKRFNR